jgi:tetratricopeptide (TPR) repeat protein
MPRPHRSRCLSQVYEAFTCPNYLLVMVLLTVSLLSTHRSAAEPLVIQHENGSSKFYEASYALLIGMVNYTDENSWNSLPSVKAELDDIGDMLDKHNFEVTYLIDRPKKHLFEEVDNFLSSHNHRDSRILIYVSGHGYIEPEMRSIVYFIPVDAPNPSDPTFFSVAVKDSDIEGWLQTGLFRSKHVLLLLDMCFSGGVVPRERKDVSEAVSLLWEGWQKQSQLQHNEKGTKFSLELMKEPNQQIFAAGRYNKSVPGESDFAKAFVRGLTNVEADTQHPYGIVTASELGMWLQAEIRRGGKHEPQYFKSRSNSGELIFDLSTYFDNSIVDCAQQPGADETPVCDFEITAGQLARLVRDRAKIPEELTPPQRMLIRRLQSDLDLDEIRLREALEIVSERNVPASEIAEKLREIGAGLVEVSEIARLRELPRGHNLKQADAFLARLQAGSRALFDELLLEDAALSADRGVIALTELRYGEAADHFEFAAERVPASHQAVRNDYRARQAEALYRHGDETHDNEALVQAIDLNREIGDALSRELAPIPWAEAQYKLGRALETLGWQERNAARIKEATVVFSGALEVVSFAQEPALWTTITIGQGKAHQALASLENSLALRQEAVAVLRSAADKLGRGQAPTEWAALQHALGNALRELSYGLRFERPDEAIAHVQEAIDAHLRGLEESTADNSDTRADLGAALEFHAWLTGDKARFEQALKSYRLALQATDREHQPDTWAETQHNMGIALRSLGSQEISQERKISLLEQALAAFRLALAERRRWPLKWAETQSELGLTLYQLGTSGKEFQRSRVEEAVDAFRHSLEQRSREGASRVWAITQFNLGFALRMLAWQAHDTARFEEALEAFRLSLAARSREREPLEWAATQSDIGLTLYQLGREELKSPHLQEVGMRHLEEALEAFRLALEERTLERIPLGWAETQNTLGLALWEMGDRKPDASLLDMAEARLQSAEPVYRQAGQDQKADSLLKNISAINQRALELRMAAPG